MDDTHPQTHNFAPYVSLPTSRIATPAPSSEHSYYPDDSTPALPPPVLPVLDRNSLASDADPFRPDPPTVNRDLHQSSSFNSFSPFRDEKAPATPGGALPSPVTSSYGLQHSRRAQYTPVDTRARAQRQKRRPRWLLPAAIAFLGVLIVVGAIVLGVFLSRRGGNGANSSSSSSSSSNPSSSGSPSPGSGNPNRKSSSSVVYGGDGTSVTTEDGKTFTYTNKFGGYFAVDPKDPFNNNARAQSWSPPLNQSWQWGKDQVLGVNLGGWLVLEPFITPAIYQKYPTAIDEWTLAVAMAADTASGGLNQLEDHYKTFITEEDFAQIAAAGLNWVRLPIPFWAIDTWEGEPFLPRVCWKYALKAFDWARKYGIRILLDLHSTPGSQNGYNHSGQSNKVNFLNGVMGIANAQRLLHYIRIITEFISQPQYRDVVQMFGIVNEPTGMPMEPVFNFYLEAHRMIRNITGVGAGNGPYISIQGGDPNLPTFVGADRIAIEQHPYFAFDGAGNLDPKPYIPRPCDSWGKLINDTQKQNGVTTAGEWSLGFNDCGLLLRSAANEHSTKNCQLWDHWENYTAEQKADLLSFAKANMDALQHWFFWTWKVGPSAIDNMPRSPLWSYKLGLDNGWIPQNPRDARGHCASLGVAMNDPFDGTFQAYQTGAAGAGTVNAADVARYGAWPPTSIGLVSNAAVLPTYTATGSVPTLPPQTYAVTASVTADVGDGWFNTRDTARGMTTVAGCAYPNAWDATGVAVPLAACTGASSGAAPPPPLITAAPTAAVAHFL